MIWVRADMKKSFIVLLISVLLCGNIFAQESSGSEIAFPQIIVRFENLFSFSQFEFLDGTKIKNNKELNVLLKGVPENSKFLRKANFWKTMTFVSTAAGLGCLGATAFVDSGFAVETLCLGAVGCLVVDLFSCFMSVSYKNIALDNYNLYALQLERKR